MRCIWPCQSVKSCMPATEDPWLLQVSAGCSAPQIAQQHLSPEQTKLQRHFIYVCVLSHLLCAGGAKCLNTCLPIEITMCLEPERQWGLGTTCLVYISAW